MNKNTILLIGFLFVIVGCISTQKSEFYMLRSVPPEASNPVENMYSDITVRLKVIKIPLYLDRPQIVTRNVGYTLHIDEYHRWAEPLKENFSHKFAEDLSARISPGHIERYGEQTRSKFDYQLVIEILRLDMDEANSAVVFDVKWSLQDGSGKRLLKTHTENFIIPVNNKSFDARVEAHSIAVSMLADKVAENLRTEY